MIFDCSAAGEAVGVVLNALIAQHTASSSGTTAALTVTARRVAAARTALA